MVVYEWWSRPVNVSRGRAQKGKSRGECALLPYCRDKRGPQRARRPLSQ